MFGIFESVAKAAIGVVSLPVSIAADVVTLGGALTDKDTPYTVKNVEDIVENLENVVDPEKN